jgi:hypothetical protein
MDRLVELFDSLLEQCLVQLTFQGIYLGLFVFVFIVQLRSLSRLDCAVAVILNLLNIPSTLFNKIEEVRMPADLKLLHICQVFGGSLMTG